MYGMVMQCDVTHGTEFKTFQEQGFLRGRGASVASEFELFTFQTLSHAEESI